MLLFLLSIPFLAQGTAMIFDEFYFHRRRGLPRWERLGHPADTLTVLATYAFLLLSSPTLTNLLIYTALALFSCVFVTKDEFIHKEECESSEMWLHSVLFILHPLSFLSAALIVYLKPQLLDAGLTLTQMSFLESLIVGQVFIVIAFLVYQIVYWNILYDAKIRN